MNAPITNNSITERVHFTGLYVPEERWEEDEHAANVDSDAGRSNVDGAETARF